MNEAAAVDRKVADDLRLFLSSTRLDDVLTEQFLEFLKGRVRAGVVANAIDGMAESERAPRVRSELELLSRLGLRPREIDLRDHFGTERSLLTELSEIDVLWVRGGNVFVLRSAMALSGCDGVLQAIVPDGLAYAGYSAGSCVVGSTLLGLELADDPLLVERAHGGEVEWRGLGLLDRAIVPHCDSPRHPKTQLLDSVAAVHRRDGRAYVSLRDGQALMVRGHDTVLI